jgi:predicted N-acetyltransferase YhbS
VHLRLAEIGEAEAITTVINAAFRKAESFLVDHDRVDLDVVRSLLEKGRFLVAAENSGAGCALAGCVYVELRSERAYLGLLSADPQRQRAGLGSRLMDAAEDFCAKSGARFMDLRIVSVRRELPSFYQHRGYIETGTTPFTPDLNPKVACHFIEMSKPLTPKP